MPLSIAKLEQVLHKQALKVIRFLSVDERCYYVHVENTRNADTFMLYIPSKYTIHVAHTDPMRIDSMEVIDIDDNGSVITDYASTSYEEASEEARDDAPRVQTAPSDNESEEEDVQSDTGDDGRLVVPDRLASNTEEQVASQYATVLQGEPMSTHDRSSLYEIFRQLKRLRYCMETVKYRLCITYKNYLCCLTRHDDLEGFKIIPSMKRYTQPGHDRTKSYTLLPTIDLEAFSRKSNSVLTDDIDAIRKTIHSVLEKNEKAHLRNLQHVLERQTRLKKIQTFCASKRNEAREYFEKFDRLLSQLTVVERKTHEELKSVRSEYHNTSRHNIHPDDDLKLSHKIGVLKTELSKIAEIHKSIKTQMQEIRSYLDNAMLVSDRVLFDNLVMLDSVHRNFELLAQKCNE